MTDRTHRGGWAREDSVGLAGLAAIIAATAVIGVGPPILQLLNRESVRRTIEQTAGLAREASSANERVRKEQAVLDQRLEESKVTLQPASRLNHRVMELVELGSEAGLAVSRVAPAAPRTIRQSVVTRLTVTGEGGYSSIADFLGLLHGRFPDVVVHGFAAGAGRRDNSEAGEFRFDLDWYAAPDDSAGVRGG